MARIEAHGLSAQTPSGWDSQIYVRPPETVATVPGSSQVPNLVAAAGVTRPIAHLANFGLPPQRGDFGGGAVELMQSGGVFIAIVELDPADASKPLFAQSTKPWPLTADDFSPDQMQRPFDGQAGCQRFFADKGRAFCLYVVLGSHRARAVLVKVVNQALAGFEIT